MDGGQGSGSAASSAGQDGLRILARIGSGPAAGPSSAPPGSAASSAGRTVSGSARAPDLPPVLHRLRPDPGQLSGGRSPGSWPAPGRYRWISADIGGKCRIYPFLWTAGQLSGGRSPDPGPGLRTCRRSFIGSARIRGQLSGAGRSPGSGPAPGRYRRISADIGGKRQIYPFLWTAGQLSRADGLPDPGPGLRTCCRSFIGSAWIGGQLSRADGLRIGQGSGPAAGPSSAPPGRYLLIFLYRKHEKRRKTAKNGESI